MLQNTRSDSNFNQILIEYMITIMVCKALEFTSQQRM